MKAVSAAQMRELDRFMIEEYDTSGEELMRRAGKGVANLVSDLAERARFNNPLVQLVAGRGNNGGDAFAAACYLHDDEFDVEVLLAGTAGEVKGDALRHLGRMRSAGIPLQELPTQEDWEEAIQRGDAGQILVDGVLGVGAKGPPRGPIAGAIRYLKAMSDMSLVVAIDVPSGLDADTGETPGEAVIADLTATIGLPKQGLLLPRALPWVGNVEVVQIGIPLERVQDLTADAELITDWDLRPLFPRRPRAAHKGLYGHVLIVAGAAGYAGAAALAARGATRSGAGLVSVLTPRGIAPVVAAGVPEAMVHAAAETAEGTTDAATWTGWRARLAGFDAVVAGPGMTRHADTAAGVRTLLAECRQPMVLDADALNALGSDLDGVARAAGPVVLTPHPGELARLLGCRTEEIQADRRAAARHAAERSRATVVLKGAGTVVAQAGRPLAINLTGNPGMATGGMGDVLSGLIGGLLAQKLAPFDAACAGVYLHGRAGDSAAWRRSQAALTAADVLDELPYVFREVATR
jgi:NAD(P)H-hydrate epimerase